MRAHHCHALGCNSSCPPRWLMCRPCWSKVPADLQAEVYRTVGLRGPSVDATWAPWRRAQARAIAHVAMLREPNETKRDAYITRELAFADLLETRFIHKLDLSERAGVRAESKLKEDLSRKKEGGARDDTGCCDSRGEACGARVAGRVGRWRTRVASIVGPTDERDARAGRDRKAEDAIKAHPLMRAQKDGGSHATVRTAP